MPHQCLECGETFREGSVEILEGCPECEGTRFFHTDESLDADERQDLREQTQETVKEAIQEALEDPDDDVWSWERREEWLRLDPDEAREVLHDVVGSDASPKGDSPMPTVKEAVQQLPEGAPEADEGTSLSFPESPDPDARTRPDPGEDAGTDPPSNPSPEDEPEPRSDTTSPSPASPSDPGEAEDSEGVTPADLANAIREDPGDSPPSTEPATEPTTEPDPSETAPPEAHPREDRLDEVREPPGPIPPGEDDLEPPTTPGNPPAPQGDSVDDPNPDPGELPGEPAAEDDGASEGRVGTVNVEEPGRYDIDVESLLDTSPVIIEKDGHYMVHLPSVFSSVDEGEDRR